MPQRRRPWRTGQIVVAQAVGAALVASAFAPGWVFLGVAALSAAALVATFGRAGGRWWFEAVALRRRFRRRRHQAAAGLVAAAVHGEATSPQLVWLRTLAPALSARPVTLAGTTVGVGSDGDGWFAAVEVDPLADGAPAALAADVPGAFAAVPPASHRPEDEATVRSPWAPGAVAAAPSLIPYRELEALLAADAAGAPRAGISALLVVLRPADAAQRPRPVWVAVRITPADALALHGSAGVGEVERTVAAAAVRAARVLGGAGWPARAVTSDRLLAVLAEATGLAGPPQEEWTYWRSGRGVRTHYALPGWTPEHGAVSQAVTQLAVRLSRRAPGVLAAVAVVAGDAASVGGACRALIADATARGLRPRRLDGEHGPAVYAAGPTAHSGPS